VRHVESLRTGIALVAVAAAVLLGGCWVKLGPGEPQADSSTLPTPSVEATSAAQPSIPRPSIAKAENATLALAKKVYPEAPIKSASVLGIGRAPGGIWWFQALTDAGTKYQNELWFVTWDGAKWALKGHGPGTVRTDYPHDIEWEDVY
jgi:hypothetical protein